MQPAELPLRDIHLPEPVSWWPPAPGWWLLGGLVLCAGIALLAWRRYRRKTQARREALAQLERLEKNFAEQGEPVEAVRALSALLRRASISFYPRQENASLTGERWLRYLDSTSDFKGFDSARGRVLAQGPYGRHVERAQVEDLIELARGWLQSQPGRSRAR